ncbi:MAG TPA: glucose-1-phosphate adenylyltransferase [Gammaproteobacteria bacterium]|nr:glucose-1-phosphate adenylyltransferase [Gammaproteobacteria bacterium]
MSSSELASRQASQISRDTLALVLAGGRGSRLGALTSHRSKPAVPFGGRYRIIDFTLSNCVNSGIRRIGVMTQYKAHSLIHHIGSSWSFLHREFGEFVEILPAQQQLGTAWYAGTADAVYQNLEIIRAHDPRFVLVLGGDHVYKMDYGLMLGFHVNRGADVTVGCIPVPLGRASAFGIMATDGDGRVLEFEEKPPVPRPMADSPGEALASMGIYVFDTGYLLERLLADAADTSSSHDFGKNIIPDAVRHARTYAYPFVDHATQRPAYWRDVGDLDSYWAANMELIGVTPELNLYDRDWPIWSYQQLSPPAKFIFDEDERRGTALDSMVAEGCIISGAQVRHSLLFNDVTVEQGSSVDSSVLLPGAHIGKGCRLRNTVVETGCYIPDGTSIGMDRAEDARRFEVASRGTILVTPEMLEQSLSYAR